ncbi:hypothetical protein AALB47_22980 [Lachnospiraceae bacterium 54-11]
MASSNPAFDAVSKYRRAPQINWLIRNLTYIFGNNYYVYKLVPLCLSSFSMGMMLFLTNKLTSHKFMLFIVTLLMSFQSLLVCYHINIRFYLWNEAVILVLAFLLYLREKTTKIAVRFLIDITYFLCARFTYSLHPSEESYLAVFVVGIAAWGINLAGRYLFPWLCQRRLERWLILAVCLIVLFLEFYIMGVKNGKVEAPRIWERFAGVGTIASTYFYIPLYFLKEGLLFTIALFSFGFIVVEGKTDYGITGIYMLGLLPLLAYCVFFSDMYILRGIVSYIPMMILVVAFWFDRWPYTWVWRGLMLLITIIAVWVSYPRLNVIQFFKEPDILMEFNMHDYGSLVAKAQEEICNGRKCIAVWANESQEACFDIDAEYSFAINDSVNNRRDITEEDIIGLYVYLMNTKEKYILLVGPHTDFRIDEIMPGFMYGMKANFPYDEYKHYEFIIYIN